MAELSQICRAAREFGRNEPLWLATVMRVKGLAYRQPGARMLFHSGGTVLAGSVSAGCLEAAIVRRAPWLAHERPACMHFDGSREEDGDSPRRSGCDATVHILIERVSFDAPCAPLTMLED